MTYHSQAISVRNRLERLADIFSIMGTFGRVPEDVIGVLLGYLRQEDLIQLLASLSSEGRLPKTIFRKFFPVFKGVGLPTALTCLRSGVIPSSVTYDVPTVLATRTGDPGLDLELTVLTLSKQHVSDYQALKARYRSVPDSYWESTSLNSVFWWNALGRWVHLYDHSTTISVLLEGMRASFWQALRCSGRTGGPARLRKILKEFCTAELTAAARDVACLLLGDNAPFTACTLGFCQHQLSLINKTTVLTDLLTVPMQDRYHTLYGFNQQYRLDYADLPPDHMLFGVAEVQIIHEIIRRPRFPRPSTYVRKVETLIAIVRVLQTLRKWSLILSGKSPNVVKLLEDVLEPPTRNDLFLFSLFMTQPANPHRIGGCTDSGPLNLGDELILIDVLRRGRNDLATYCSTLFGYQLSMVRDLYIRGQEDIRLLRRVVTPSTLEQHWLEREETACFLPEYGNEYEVMNKFYMACDAIQAA